jgi:type I restriction enzyme S subunit
VNTVEFGTLFRFIRNGMNVKQDKSGDGLPITRIETISDATVDGTRVGFAGLQEADCRDWFLETGDILFSHINSVEHVGKCAVYRGKPEKLVHGMNLLCLRSDTAKLLPEFAKYLMRGTEFRTRLSNFINKAVNQASVSIGNLKTIPVTVPPLAEQRRIAEVLDRAEALRAKRRAALAQLAALTQSLFLDLFGDPATNSKGFPKTPLASLIRGDDTINYGVVQPGDGLDEGVPLVRVGDLIEGKVRHSDLKRIAPSIEAAYKRSRLRGDEILVSCVGSIGVVAMANESVKGFNIARAVARIPLAETTSRLFMAAYLSTDFVQRYFTNELRTVSQPTLNIKQLSETTVVLPPIELQHEFARRVEAAEKLKTAQRAALAELDALFATLQHRAFKGEL